MNINKLIEHWKALSIREPQNIEEYDQLSKD